MTDTGRVSGVVLAGGRSTRFGRDKLAEPVGTGSLLDRAIAAIGELCTDVTVVVGASAPDPALGERPLATVRVVRDSEPDRGPVLGLATGLEAAPNPIVLVVGGDMPTLVADVLRLLLEEVAAGAPAAALEEGGRPRPLPAAFERSVGLAAARGVLAGGGSQSRSEGARLRAVLAALETVVIPEAVWRELDPDGATLRDVDRPDDLAGLGTLG
jgi:molybdopterin-guanine dinucleotide biosynthesis protein A